MRKIGNRKRLFPACLAACAIAMTPVGIGFCTTPQMTSNDINFEVATIRPVLRDGSHRFNPKHSGAHVNPAAASYWFMTVGFLVAYAYGVEPNQVVGPEWTTADRFDIEARFPAGADKKDDRRMLQALLKDRLRLAFHIEKREFEVYGLVVGKHGEKLKPSPPNPNDVPSQAGDSNSGVDIAKSEITKNSDGSSKLDMGQRGTQTFKLDKENSAMHWEHSKMTMEELAERLSVCIDINFHEVVDYTEIKGYYQVAYDCPLPNPHLPAGTDAADMMPSDPQGASSLTRSLDALGLKLERRKILRNVYVIDHVERPSEN